MQVVRWASDYQATLQDLGIEEEDTKFPSEDKSGLNMLMEKYITGMRTTRQDWLKNIIKAGALIACSVGCLGKGLGMLCTAVRSGVGLENVTSGCMQSAVPGLQSCAVLL